MILEVLTANLMLLQEWAEVTLVIIHETSETTSSTLVFDNLIYFCGGVHCSDWLILGFDFIPP